MTNQPNQFIQNLRYDLLKFYGFKCNNPLCQIHYNLSKLEFAHIINTDLSGMGRGRKERYYDIKYNPECYILLCKDCHKDFDRENL